MSAMAVRLGREGVLRVPSPVTIPTEPLRRTGVPALTASPSGSFWRGLISPHPLTETSRQGPWSPSREKIVFTRVGWVLT